VKILLINPPFYRFVGLEQDYVPLSLLSVGAWLEKDGHKVSILNLEVGSNLKYVGYSGRSNSYNNYLKQVEDTNHLIWNELRNTIVKEKPDTVGITILNVKSKSAKKIISILQSEYPHIDIFVGGYHPTIEPEEYLGDVEVIRGEFESTVRLENLDNLPYFNYDSLLNTYSKNGYAHIVTARGCPFKCKFCCSKLLWNRKVTYKSIDRLLKEMRLIEDTFHSDLFTIWDETFTISNKRLLDFCSRYSLASKWSCDTRADVLNEEKIVMMKNAGCAHMGIGVECGSDKSLKIIGKNETIQTIRTTAELLYKHGVLWKAYCIIGFPHETEQDIIETIEFIKSLTPFRIVLSFFTPYKGTDLYEDCLKQNLITTDFDLAMYSHQSPYNYFCPNIEKEKWIQLRNSVSKSVDNYNKDSIKIWR